MTQGCLTWEGKTEWKRSEKINGKEGWTAEGQPNLHEQEEEEEELWGEKRGQKITCYG